MNSKIRLEVLHRTTWLTNGTDRLPLMDELSELHLRYIFEICGQNYTGFYLWLKKRCHSRPNSTILSISLQNFYAFLLLVAILPNIAKNFRKIPKISKNSEILLQYWVISQQKIKKPQNFVTILKNIATKFIAIFWQYSNPLLRRETGHIYVFWPILFQYE